MQKIIFLVDMNAFFITCEMRRNPELRGKPAAVAGDPLRRSGIILAANYEARAYGIRTTMTINQALRLYPDLLLVPPDHEYYEEVSEKVMEFLSRFTPTVEQNSIDEAWLDMSGTENLFGPPLVAAKTIMDELKNELDLWCSIGISENKFLAKMASEMKKPLGITWLEKKDIPERLWPLPVNYMYGVGAKTTASLNTMNILTIGDLAKTDRNKLIKHFGKSGISMHDHAQGIDHDALLPRSQDDIKSIGKSTTLEKDINDIEAAKLILLKLSDEVSLRARARHKKGHTVQITLKYTDFSVITRQCQIHETNLSRMIYETGLHLLSEVWNSHRPVRLIGIAITDFHSSEAKQLSLFDLEDQKEQESGDPEKEERVQQAVDTIRQKFGKDILSRASLIRSTDTHDDAPSLKK